MRTAHRIPRRKDETLGHGRTGAAAIRARVVAALVPVVEEAGGVFTDWDGRPGYPATSAVATNAKLAAEVRDLLGAV